MGYAPWAMRLIFGMAGVGISLWAIIVPYTKIRFGLSDGTLGWMLLAGGGGGLLMMPAGGAALTRFGSRAVLVAAGAGAGLLLPALCTAASPRVFTLLLLAYGALFGMLDTAINAQAGVVEKRSGRLLMSGFHAAYSLGSLGVAVVDGVLLRLGCSELACALLGMAAMLALLLNARLLLPKTADSLGAGPVVALPNSATIVLGLCCFVAFFTEGAATDWSTIFMRFSRGVPLAGAALGYAAFAVAMAAARLSGDAMAGRIGKAMLLRVSCLAAAGGMAMVVLLRAPVLDIAGFGLVGLGTGNITPLVMRAASKVRGVAASHAVPAVLGVGYAGFLSAPVAIGLLSDHVGLPGALALNGVLLAAVCLAGRAVAA